MKDEIISVSLYEHGYEINLEGRFVGIIDNKDMDFILNIRDWEVLKRIMNKVTKDFIDISLLSSDDVRNHRFVLIITKSSGRKYKVGEIFISDVMDIVTHSDKDSVFLDTERVYYALEKG